MIEQILIVKDPNLNDHLPYLKDFKYVIDWVDTSDILDYILSAINCKWAPTCYWNIYDINDNLFIGQLYWIVYSYLVYNKILIIEDRYFGYNSSRTNKYIDRYSYFSPLEECLYSKIIDRMVDQKLLTFVNNEYKLGPIYYRNTNLEKILN